jgi:hypothetical protein
MILPNMILDGKAWAEPGKKFREILTNRNGKIESCIFPLRANIFIIEDAPTYWQKCQENQ